MKTNPLKNMVQEKVKEVRLRHQKRDDLMSLIQQKNTSYHEGYQVEGATSTGENVQHDDLKTKSLYHAKLIPFLWGVVASFVLVVALYIGNVVRVNNAALEISEELVNNHLKLKPLEIEDKNFNTLKQYFTELDFVPVQSRLNIFDNTLLMGGRYCSVAGKAAAQLRYRNDKEKLTTLYQVNYDKERFAWVPNIPEGGKVMEKTHRGLTIHFWRENGVVFASVF